MPIESKLLMLAEMLHITFGPLADELKDSHPWVMHVLGDYRRWRNGELVAALGEEAAAEEIAAATDLAIIRLDEVIHDDDDFILWANEFGSK